MQSLSSSWFDHGHYWELAVLTWWLAELWVATILRSRATTETDEGQRRHEPREILPFPENSPLGNGVHNMRRQESTPPNSAGLVDRRKVVKATWAERVRVPSGKEAEVKGWIETPAPHPQFPFWPRGDHLPSWIRTCPLIIILLQKLREIVRNSKIKDSFCFKPGRLPGGFPVYLNPSFVKRGNNNNNNNKIIIIMKDTEVSPLFFACKKSARA